MKALYEGEGVSPPHYDERAPLDGAESEAGDEEDEEEPFQQENFVTSDMLFTQNGPLALAENRDTLDLPESTPQHQPNEEEGEEEEEREAELQF